MSSKAGKIAKQVNNKKLFPDEMYENFIGSCLICNYMFEQWDSEKFANVIKKWKTVKRNPGNYFKSIPETWDINCIYKVFETPRTWDWPVCICTSDFNCLCVPYATDDDKIIPLPIREDCFYPATVRKAKTIQVVDWNGELQKNEEDKSESIIKSE